MVRGIQFDGITGLRTGEQLEDLVTKSTPADGSEMVDQETLETYLDTILNIYRLRVKDGSITSAKLAPGAAIPAGAVMAFAMVTPPVGWLECDGSLVSIASYANLYAAIGTTYGSGSGTFGLPSMKGKVPVGLDSSQVEFDVIGETGGAKTHTLTTAQIPSHAHTLWAALTPGYDGVHAAVGYGHDSGGPTVTTDAAGSGNAHNNLQPYIVLKWCIKT